ncbi:MAG: carboxypeptidase regulatory-like domain-containing protein [Bryobacteraceae bacterium]
MVRVLLLAVVCAAGLEAQDVNGAIGGRVTDASGAAIAGAKVSAMHTETGASREAETDAAGAFVFPDLPIGAYQVSAAHPGFKRSVKTGIVLHVSEHIAANLQLEVGELTQEVTVAGSAEQVQTESSEQGGLITGEQITELQLNGRSFMTLLELVPGVASNMPDRADPNTSASLSVNGARSTGNNFNIDGGNNADVVVGGSALNTFTSVDTIAEFKVLTSTFSAEYGRGGLSQINVVTKSGTKKFHGSLYEFFRNDALDATDYFSHSVLPLKLNNFGYTIGGPVARDKTFFFWAQEFNRISIRGAAVNTTVPTAEERRGDFRALGWGRDGREGTGDDPVIDPTTGLGIPGGVIPASRIDPNAVKILSLFPLPNFKGPGQINYTSAVASHQNWREEMLRIDHNFSQKLKVFGRYVQDSAYVQNPYGGSGYTSITTRFPGVAETKSDRPGKNLVLNATSVVNSALLNQAAFTWSRRLFAMESISQVGDRSKLGFNVPELFPENPGNLLPTVNISGYAGLNVPKGGHKQLFVAEISDNLTRIAGRHVIKTGMYWSLAGNREHSFNPNTAGTFSFTTGFTKNAVANLLLGLPETYSEVEKVIYSDARFSMLEAYVQDDMRASNRLTLNIGLRWSDYFNPYDRAGMIANFLPGRWDPARAPRINPANGQTVPDTGDPLNGIVIADKDSPYGRRITNNNTNLWGPRFGFAFDPFGRKTSAIRGGYGIYYTRAMIGTFVNNTLSNPPFTRSVTLQRPTFDSLRGTEAPVSIRDLIALSDPLLAAMVQQWSLGVEHELFRTIVKVSYVGSHSTHLQRPVAINGAPPGMAAALKVHYNAVRPFLGYGNITERQTSGSASYNSLQVSVNRRALKRFTFGLAYTFGKTIDTASSERDGDTPPPDRTQAQRGLADYHRAHILTTNFIWNLPKFGPTQALRGWQLSGITRMWSGRPFDVGVSTDVAGIGSTQAQRPDIIADTRGPRTPEQWFNRDAFARPVTGAYGNMGRNTLIGPGVNKWDLAVYKTFVVTEKLRLQFRGEAFNAFNHPSFTTVGSTLYTTATGIDPTRNNFAVVTATRDARVLQFALKLTF